MTGRCIAAAAALVAVAAIAAPVVEADGDGDPAALVAEGEALARAGEYSRAIARFKEAERQEPHAANACRIGLAYLRRELWPQAELFLDQCRRRSSATDPVPDWIADAEAQLAAKLGEVDVAAIDIRVSPPEAAAEISVSSFAPDERFAPRTIHLPPGSYVLTVSAAGYRDGQATVTVSDRTAQSVAVELEKVPVAGAVPVRPSPAPAVEVDDEGPRSGHSTWVLVGAAGLAAAGGVFHVLAARERAELEQARDDDDPMHYDDHRGRFLAYRAVTVGCYAGALAAAGVGLWLRIGERRDRAVAVRPSLEPGRAMVLVEWRR